MTRFVELIFKKKIQRDQRTKYIFQEKVLELLEIPEELDNIAEFRPTEENCRSFWSHMMEERRQVSLIFFIARIVNIISFWVEFFELNCPLC